MDKALEALAHDEVDAASARDAVWRALDGQTGFREAYAALCRWTWRVTVERRLDDELRSWHRLLLDAAAKLASHAPAVEGRSRMRARLEPIAAAERIRALADVVRLSIEAAAASIPSEMGKRAHVLEILHHLADSDGNHVEREQIRKAIGLGDANLSRVLTLMTANGLVERLPRGKVASFRATQRGLSLVAAPDPQERARARSEMPPPPRLPKPDLDRSKTQRFEPATVVRFHASVRETEHEPAHDEHEPTYTPLRVTRGPIIGSGGNRRPARTHEREFAL